MGSSAFSPGIILHWHKPRISAILALFFILFPRVNRFRLLKWHYLSIIVTKNCHTLHFDEKNQEFLPLKWQWNFLLIAGLNVFVSSLIIWSPFSIIFSLVKLLDLIFYLFFIFCIATTTCLSVKRCLFVWKLFSSFSCMLWDSLSFYSISNYSLK